MQPSVLVTEYLDRLTRELRFDPQLSRRARREVEDHLLDASEMMPTATAAKPRAWRSQDSGIPGTSRGSMHRYPFCNRRAGSVAY